MKPLIQLTIKEAQELSVFEIMDLNRAPDMVTAQLTEFTIGENHMALLKAIHARALRYMNSNDPICQKTHQRIRNLRKEINNKNAGRRKKQWKRFLKTYSESLYESHEVTSQEWNTTMLKINENGTAEKTDEEDLLFVEYIHCSEMTAVQKNDATAIIGHSFGRSMKKEDFSHDNARVTHELLSGRNDTGIAFVKFVDRANDKGIPMIHIVGVAVFAPMTVKQHNVNGTTSDVSRDTVNAVNLVQIGVLPSWSGFGFGKTVVEKGLWERLQQRLKDKHKYDLMIICGCTKTFYAKLEGIEGGNPDQYPPWLYESPFNLPSDDEGVSDEQHNREIFFFQPLTTKFITNVEETGLQFSFETSEYLKGYYGHDIEG